MNKIILIVILNLFLSNINSMHKFMYLMDDPDIINIAELFNSQEEDQLGNSILHKCILCSNLNTELIEKYIDNLDIQNLKGSTALHLAVEHNKKEIVQLLLEYGADRDIKDNFNRRPIDYADDEELISILNNTQKKDFEIKFFDIFLLSIFSWVLISKYVCHK